MTTLPKPAPSGPVQLEINLGNRLEIAMKKLGDTIHQRSQQRKAQQQQTEPPPSIQDTEQSQIDNSVQPANERQVEVDKVVHLPVWPTQTRGTPNGFLRGALFAAIQGKEREYMKAAVVCSQAGIEIRFTGMQLDQFDLDVWEQAVQQAAQHPLGNVCLLKVKAFLRELGRHDGKTDRNGFMDSVRRLAACCVEIKHGPHIYGGSLLEFWHDEEADAYKLQHNPRLLALYQAGWTTIDWEQRAKLRRKPLALWLHGWLSSNAENYSTKVETIQQLCGSRDKTLFGFRRNLKAALSALQAAGVATSWTIDPKTDLVNIERTPSSPQQRHLIRKLTKRKKSQT